MLNRKLSLILTTAAAILITVTLLHAFRSESQDNPALGVFEYQYCWWKPRRILLDSNRDGEIDFMGVLVTSATDFGYPFEEHWEDRDFDGRFEIHAIYSDARVSAVELDDDGDGIYERRLTGYQAEHYYDQFLDQRNSKEDDR